MSDDAVAADARPSPLNDEHVALGATLVPFAGWSMPLRYRSDIAEHTAVRTAAGLFDLSHMAELAVLGPDAGAFLDHALVGSFSRMAVGKARYTMICVESGAVLDDLIVYRTGDAEYLVVANAANHDPVLAALRDRVGDLDVAVQDRTDTTALVAVQGPRALEILRSTPGLVAEGLVELRYYAALEGTFDVDGEPRPVLIARTGYTGEDGFELFVDAASVGVPLWRALLAAGEPFGLVPAGLAARDSLRLEAGMPLYGHELDLTVTPYAAGLGRVVKLEKTDAHGRPIDFVGRAALDARAHAAPARVLVGLVGESRRAARQGYVVTTRSGAPVGRVTSGAPSPTLGVPIAMAYVTPEVSAEGTALAVDVRGRPEPVHVVALPFYRRP
ncbi:glycine cleavage system aminomethyltransferase GcvT [Isoptericola sp. b490]|uniref:glycine cleavage system aminomethyltransferase GcvT n=1 Tax=Actinotalea lenta TaxID=3064654 RepID=UPI0027136F53|nr:glycine cleavage system aminomethyltransferase GcvT [Isoptericola sp. b490]MDO8122197.1 glycine cleavage system aminomethyltransferase GcvT [Isoptericola sp. b490]